MVNPVNLIAILVFASLLILLIQKFSRPIAFFAASANLFLSIKILALALKKPFLVNLGGWKAPFCISLLASPLSASLALLISFIGLLAIVFSFTYIKRQTVRYYAVLLLLLAGSLGVVLTADIFNMFVFFEILCISSYALVAFTRTASSFEAAFKYLVLGSLGSSFILIGISIIYGLFGTLNLAEIASRISFPLNFPLKIALALFIAGFGVEAAIFPFNAWLPDAHPAAPSPVSSLLSGLAIKVGLYALLRLIFTVFGYDGIFLPLAVLAALTFVIGEVSAFSQNDLKRMLAYSSIGQIGLIAMAISLGSAYSVTGGFLQLFNHAFSKSLLFLASGAFFLQRKSLNLSDLKGIGRENALITGAFVVGILSLMGLPPFFGFFSKLAILVGMFSKGGVLAYVFLFLIVVLTGVEAAYFLKVLGIFYQKTDSSFSVKTKAALVIPTAVLALTVIILGLFPRLAQKVAYFSAHEILNKASYIKLILG